MKTRSHMIVTAISATFVLLMGIGDEAVARGRRWRRSRGGGGGGFSRSGAASSGSFSSGAGRSGSMSGGSSAASASRSSGRSQSAQTGSTNRSAASQTASTNKAAAQQSRQSASSANQAQRQSSSSQNQAQRQQYSNENVETRQQGATSRTQSRQQTAQSNKGAYYGSGYHPPAGAYPTPAARAARADYYDDNNWDDGEVAAVAVGAVAVGAVAGYAAGQSSQSYHDRGHQRTSALGFRRSAVQSEHHSGQRCDLLSMRFQLVYPGLRQQWRHLYARAGALIGNGAGLERKSCRLCWCATSCWFMLIQLKQLIR